MKQFDNRILNLGCYFFPFIQNSFDAISVINEGILLDEYLEKADRVCVDPRTGAVYISSEEEMKSRFNFVIKTQRIWYKAALLVCDETFISINPALRSLGVKI